MAQPTTVVMNVLLLCCLMTPQIRAEEMPPIEDADKLFRFLWIGVKESRDQLRTGSFRVNGRELIEKADGSRIEGEVEGFSAFDFPAGRLRFDRLGPPHSDNSPVDEDGKLGGKWIRTPKKVIWMRSGSADAVTMKPDSPAIDYIPVFDIRSAGLGDWRALVKGVPFEDTYGVFPKIPPASFEEESPGVYRFDTFLGSTVRRSVWVDSLNGYTTLKSALAKRSPDSGDDRWQEPYSLAEATWQEQDGVWVPVTFIFVDRTEVGSEKRVDYQIQWESINEPLPERLFTARGFDLETDSVVIDTRLGEPFVVEKIGEERQTPLPAEISITQIVEAWGSLAFVVIIAVVLLTRRVRTRRSTKEDSQRHLSQ